MKKNKALIIFTIIIIFLLISCFILFNTDKDFFGYYNDIDTARDAEKIYSNSQLITTETDEDVVIDFIIDDTNLYIIFITCRNGITGNHRYKVKAKAIYYLDEITYGIDLEELNSTPFLSTQKKLLWYISDVNHSIDKNDMKSFHFFYNSDEYIFHYKIASN